MASGDRIELLTADAFNTSVNTLSEKIDVANEAIDMHQENMNVRIGNTADSSASASSGSIMGKLNNLISNIANVVTYTKTNNTASSTGTISQKLSYLESQINAANTAIANLSAKSNGGFTVQSGFIAEKSISGDYTDVTIKSVDVSKSFVLVNGKVDMGSDYCDSSLAQLVNSTTLRIYATYSSGSSRSLANTYWQVITCN